MTCEKKRSVFTSLFVIQHGTIIYVSRNCIGQAFALAEIKTAIAMILRKFDLRVAPQNIVSNEDLQSHLILKARNGIVVNISPRSTP